MNVIDILNLMGTLSLENENIKPSEQAIFLTYLNLAHDELYSKTANFNQDILKSEIFNPNLENGDLPSTYTLSNIPFFINSVYLPSTKQRLKNITLADLILKDPDFSETGQPTFYWIQGSSVSIYPVQTAATNSVIWYCPNSVDFTLNTPEVDIPYPRNFHRILADGALYYVYQDATGFRSSEKEMLAQKRWEKGKSELLYYLYNSKKQSISTFRSI
jgi:hypothetical protein